MLGITYIAVVSLWYGAPVIFLVWLVRKRLSPIAARALLALNLTLCAAWVLTNLEHDIWRYGIPSTRYLISVYAPYMAIFGTLGWFLGSLISPRLHPASRRSGAAGA